ncbi:MAG TPA: peptidyl-prolyl cis-trans isomerase [Anaeromyxobacter sp.]|nr:peptidyl-prolyl cis-trans isomerase [Anaeromyxobacter sp.]
MRTAIVLSLVAVAQPLAARAEPVIARVGGVAITRADLASRAGDGRDEGTALRAMIEEALLSQEASRLGLPGDPEVKAAIEGQRSRLAEEAFTEAEISTAVKIAEEDLRGMYHDTADSARLVLVKVATAEDALAIVERVRAGADLAAEAHRSLDPRAAAARGDTGVMLRAQMDPALAKAVFGARVGELVGPLQLSLGWAVARVVEKRVGDDAGFESKRASLLDHARRQGTTFARRHFLSHLSKSAKVDIDKQFLDGLGSRIEGSPAEMAHRVATVNGRVLRYRDIVGDVRRVAGGGAGHLSGPAVKSQIVETVVDSWILQQEALRRGFGESAYVKRALPPLERSILAAAMTERIRAEVPPPRDPEIREYHERNSARFVQPASRTCAHLVVKSRADADRAIARIRRGESFADVARAVSMDAQTARAGGDLGTVTDGQIDALAGAGGSPALAAAIRETPPGRPSGPAQSRSGWHVIQCGPVTPAHPTPLEQVRDAIVQNLREDRFQVALAARIRDLRARAAIEIDEAGLARSAK